MASTYPRRNPESDRKPYIPIPNDDEEDNEKTGITDPYTPGEPLPKDQETLVGVDPRESDGTFDQPAAKGESGGSGGSGGDTSLTSPVTATGEISTAQPSSWQSLLKSYKQPTAAYEAGTLPTTALPTYTGATISQYAAPNTGGTQDAAQTLLNALLANPESLNASTVAAMKESQKESGLSMYEQAMDSLLQDYAQRGVGDSGTYLGQRGNSLDELIGSLTGSYRDIDIAAAQTNKADQINALTAAQNWLSGLTSNAATNYASQLSGQTAQAGENKSAYDTQAAAVQYALQQALAQEELNQAEAQSKQGNEELLLSSLLGMGNLQQNESQFNQQYLLDMMSFLNDASMDRYGLGMDYANYQQRLVEWLTGSLS